ncbi:MAG TPA: UvrD-helicase domain-containing protein [Ilumatobacter sp.]
MSAPAPLPDQRDREAITTQLSTNLFVEAGAGSGKTSSLVDRIVALVADGAEIGTIAAITFTEKAAAELRHRLRGKLAEAQAGAGPDQTTRLRAALDGLDHAPIGTLHAFARRLLNDHPVQAGLPPGFRVLDELESHLAFEQRWSMLLDQLLDDPDPPGGVTEGGTELIELCSLDNFRLHVGGKRVAAGFHANWDLVAERVDCSPPAPFRLDPRPFVEALLDVCQTPCPDADRQFDLLTVLHGLGTRLQHAHQLAEQLELLGEVARRCAKVQLTGSQKNWRSAGFDADALPALRARELTLAEQAEALLQTVRAHRVRVLGALLGGWVLDGARARAADGTVEFHDLLVLTRQLVTHHTEVRAELHHRYRRILLDEFQDTDPIQLEIAVRLASDPYDPAQAPDTGDWTLLRPLAGRLFIVGDPKQSIYRFRRADIAQYMQAAGQIGAATATLSSNFRSSGPVLDWVNHVFGRLIQFDAGIQPAYQPLEARRARFRDHGSVTVLGASAHDDLATGKKADELRWREAADVADAVSTALHDRWLVTEQLGDGEARLRPCRPGDITVLLPARTSLPALEAALRDRDLPYRAENSSVVYVTTEIRQLMLALRAADDATDQLALVAALRTPLYGCSDTELYDWRSGGGSWSIWADPPASLGDHPVAAAIAHVRSLAERSTWRTPADLLAALVDERRVLDAALDGADARDVWRRVRYVVDQARAWSDAGGHGLRRYLGWVALMASESRNADTILPEHDDDAVRIMTIHAAKGLEFPITIVSGLTTKPTPRYAHTAVWHQHTWTISSHRHDEVYADFAPLDEQMGDAERRRLLYVACTRAVDHLVVSLHRPPSDAEIGPTSTSAALLHAGDALGAGARPLEPAAGAFTRPQPGHREPGWADEGEWRRERDRAVRAAGRRTTVSATRLADELADELAATIGVEPDGSADSGLAKEPVDLDLPPWQRGRYGTAVGRAVHGVLQFTDLHTGADVDALAAAQCAAEGIDGLEQLVADLARSALATPIVQFAAGVEHHRELFVAAPTGDRLLEGYIDLLVRTDDGYVIVDYKTDDWADGTDRSARLDRYRTQLAAYAVALEAVIGEPVAGGVLVRCTPAGPAEQIALDGFAEARRAVRDALS